jgi:glycosyltransferase involved in cell wall biosynthesis
MVGPDEEGVEAELTELLADAGWRFHRLGFTDKPECYMAASDVFCLPSYREGFSLATIQAAGAGLPAVASRIYGLTDAVAEGVTGLMHEPGDIPAIVECMLRLHVDAPFREQLATAARIRAHEYFSQEYIVGEMTKFYDGVLA